MRNILLCSSVMVAMSLTMFAQISASGKLDQPAGLDRIEGQRFGDAVAILLAKSHIPGGIIRKDSCDPVEVVGATNRVYNLQGLTVRQALDQIVGGEHGYTWKVDDGVVVVLPLDGLPPLLTTVVKRYEVKFPKYEITETTNVLKQAPEIREKARELHLEEAPELLIGGPSINTYTKQLVFTNTSPYQILNSVATMQRASVWEYSEFECKSRVTFDFDWYER